MISALVACNWSQIRFFILANVPTCMSEGFWPNFDEINISHRRPCSLWIVNLLTWQKAPEGGFDEKSWEMACNWLMMTSSGDDNRPSGSLGLLTDKTKKKKKSKPKAEQETAQPTAARFKKKTRPRCGLNRALKLTVTHTVQLRFCYCFYLYANV